MADRSHSRRKTSAALDAAIERNADVVRRSRRRNRSKRTKGFLQQLGLSLPVTVDDVKQAFYTRAKETHPDHRGNSEEFRKVQEAFDEALRYAETNGKRLPWLGAQLPAYVAQRAIVELVEAWGGAVEIAQLEWLDDTVGEDFAQLADRLCAIDLSGCDIGDQELIKLFAETEGLKYLESLGLSGTRVSDDAILEVMKASQLRRIDLRGTQVSSGMRRQLAKLPRFDEVAGASRWGGWFGR